MTTYTNGYLAVKRIVPPPELYSSPKVTSPMPQKYGLITQVRFQVQVWTWVTQVYMFPFPNGLARLDYWTLTPREKATYTKTTMSPCIPFFAVSYGWDVISGNLSKLVFRRGWVTLSANFRQKGASSTNHCWCQNTRVITLSCGIKNPQRIVSFCHKGRVSQTDGRTHEQNYASQDRVSTATLRGKNYWYLGRCA